MIKNLKKADLRWSPSTLASPQGDLYDLSRLYLVGWWMCTWHHIRIWNFRHFSSNWFPFYMLWFYLQSYYWTPIVVGQRKLTKVKWTKCDTKIVFEWTTKIERDSYIPVYWSSVAPLWTDQSSCYKNIFLFDQKTFKTTAKSLAVTRRSNSEISFVIDRYNKIKQWSLACWVIYNEINVKNNEVQDLVFKNDLNRRTNRFVNKSCLLLNIRKFFKRIAERLVDTICQHPKVLLRFDLIYLQMVELHSCCWSIFAYCSMCKVSSGEGQWITSFLKFIKLLFRSQQ